MNQLSSVVSLALLVFASLAFVGCASEEAPPPEEKGTTESNISLPSIPSLDDVKGGSSGEGGGSLDDILGGLGGGGEGGGGSDFGGLGNLDDLKGQLPDFGGAGGGGEGEDGADKLKSLLDKLKK